MAVGAPRRIQALVLEDRGRCAQGGIAAGPPRCADARSVIRGTAGSMWWPRLHRRALYAQRSMPRRQLDATGL